MDRPLAVLVAEDSQDDADLLVLELERNGFSILWERVQTAPAFTEALNRQPWDLILCDYQMPQFTALDALAIVQAAGLDIPFIIVSGVVGEEVAVEAMKAGAHDFFAKGRLTRLVQSVERELREAKERCRRRRAEQGLGFLINAGDVLASSLDYEITLRNLTELIVPELADWCTITIREQGEIRQVAFKHTDPQKTTTLQQLDALYPTNPNAPVGTPKVLRTGEPELIPEISDELIREAAVDERYTRLIHEIGLKSYISVPLKVKEEVFGAITLATTESGRTYGPEDLKLLEALARRASIAVENALLYRETQERREWLAVTLSSIGDAVIAADGAGKVTFMNAVAEDLTGWSEGLAAGRDLSEVFHIISEETRQTVESPVIKVIREGNVVGLANHTLLIAKDGTEIPIDDSGAPIRDAEGNIIGVVLVFHDVSERRHAERLIQQSEERYRAFIENSSEGIWRFELDPPMPVNLPVDEQIDWFYRDAYLAECNDAMARMYGFELAADVVGMRLGQMLVRENPDNVAYLRTFIEAGYRLTDAESQEVDRYGNTMYFLNNLVGIIQDDHLVRAWGIQRDITELRQSRLRLEEALGRTRELYEISRRIGAANRYEDILEAIVSSSHLGQPAQAAISLFDKPWDDSAPDQIETIAAWGRTSETGSSPAQRPSYSVKDYLRLDHSSRDEIRVFANIETDVRLSDATRAILREQGAKSLISFPLVTSGLWYGLLAVQWNESHEVTAEEVSFMRGLVDQAAAAIYSLRLLEQEAAARQAAEEANQLKLKFLAMISHELRTPLTPIKGLVTTLLAEDVQWKPEEEHEFLEIIDRETNNLTDLVEQLIDLSRLEAGTLRIAPAPHSVQEIIDAAMPRLQSVAEAHTLQLEIPHNLPDVFVDSRRIAQIIVNLVDNACKYSPPNSPVTIRFRPSSSFVRVCVADQGRGIPVEEREAVFEAFRQAGNRPHNEQRGAGLGLAIAKALVEEHGGAIGIESRNGPGTTICFTLPRVGERQTPGDGRRGTDQ